MNAHAQQFTPTQVARIIEERDNLREMVRQMERALSPPRQLPAGWRITRMEEKLLSAIRSASPHIVHRERAMLAVYGLWDDAPDYRVLDVMLCKIRSKLRRSESGIEIETVWGRGWKIDAANAARFDDAVAAAKAASALFSDDTSARAFAAIAAPRKAGAA